MLMESFQSKGIPLVPDLFTEGKSPIGCGHAPRTVYGGDRTTAANYLLTKGSNLSIKTDTTVDRVILEGQGSELRAVGVRIVEQNGMTRDVKTKKEVIVSGGAYCSPAILLRSGIGAKTELEAQGIECKVDIPGVGKNLMDHMVILHLSSSLRTQLTETDRLSLLLNRYTRYYTRPSSLQSKCPPRSISAVERREARPTISISVRSFRMGPHGRAPER